MPISISKMSQHNVTSYLCTFHSVFSTLGIARLSQDHPVMERAAVSCNFKDLCGVNSNSDGNPNNKSNLTNFIFKTWVIQFQQSLRDNQVIYFVKNDDTINRVTPHSIERLQWTTDHEEGDTTMFVLPKYVVNEHQIQHLIIKSPNTEVFVVACYQVTSSLKLITLDKLWLKTGTGDKNRYVAINETANHFGSSMIKYLPAFRVITGCDSATSFSGIGKKTALTTLKSNLYDLMEIL